MVIVVLQNSRMGKRQTAILENCSRMTEETDAIHCQRFVMRC